MPKDHRETIVNSAQGLQAARPAESAFPIGNVAWGIRRAVAPAGLRSGGSVPKTVAHCSFPKLPPADAQAEKPRGFALHRHDGWTPGRQVAFLRSLRETGCVKAACRHVGLTTTSAYRVKARIPAFGEAWDQALAYIAPVLERAAMERAVEGWLEPIV